MLTTSVPKIIVPKNFLDLLPVIVSHSSSTSVKNIEHFSQNLIHKRFNRFDYGSEENLKKYGTVLKLKSINII